jgi:hypothetical protein
VKFKIQNSKMKRFWKNNLNWRKKKEKKRKHISILDFYCVAKNMEWLLFVHLPMDDHHKQ